MTEKKWQKKTAKEKGKQNNQWWVELYIPRLKQRLKTLSLLRLLRKCNERLVKEMKK